MKVKIVRDTMWFRAGEQYDIDTDLAKQMVALGDAEAFVKGSIATAITSLTKA